MKKEELKTRSKEELRKILEDDAEKLQKLRFDLSFNRLKDLSSIKKVKKEIARIKTLLNKK
jgi:large subunit ribosomal protein L29